MLGMTQEALGSELGCNQSNVGHYENGRQKVPVHVALKLVDLAKMRGHELSLDDIYRPAEMISPSSP